MLYLFLLSALLAWGGGVQTVRRTKGERPVVVGCLPPFENVKGK